MSRVWMAVAVAAAVVATSRGAVACDIATGDPFIVDGSPATGPAPQPPKDLSAVVTRGKASGSVSTSCDDIGIIKISLTPPTGGDVGYVVDLVAGVLPDGVSLAPTPVRQNGLIIVWVDGATSTQERVDFTVRLASVDKSGQQSVWSTPLRITDGGSASAPGSCAMSTPSAPGGAWAAFALGGALFAVRRTRRRR